MLRGAVDGGGLLFRLLDEPIGAEDPERGRPGVSVLIPAYNEENVIAVSVTSALSADYPELEVLVLDLERDYDPTILYAFLVGALYPLAFWVLAAAAALHSQTAALLRGPGRERVVWDIPRETPAGGT